jgi:hypothetical protein
MNLFVGAGVAEQFPEDKALSDRIQRDFLLTTTAAPRLCRTTITSILTRCQKRRRKATN